MYGYTDSYGSPLLVGDIVKKDQGDGWFKILAVGSGFIRTIYHCPMIGPFTSTVDRYWFCGKDYRKQVVEVGEEVIW